MLNQLRESTDYIKDQLAGKKPTIGIILGSGLGEFAENLDNKSVIDYNDIPHFHKTSVVGHKGKLVVGNIGKTQVLIFQGRFHAYEGHSQQTVVMPVRIMNLLGIKKIILTNAAGGINSDYKPGDLVAITDHINMTGQNPLIGKNIDEIGDRFPDMTEAYNKKLTQVLLATASELGIDLKSGVYAAVMGPSYETPAEIRMLSTMGADLVGMSTFAEAIAANHMGAQVCAISCVTNLAAGLGMEKLNHDEVKEVANMAMKKFTDLLTHATQRLG